MAQPQEHRGWLKRIIDEAFADFFNIASPASPKAGRVRLYAEDDCMKFKKSDGTVVDLCAAGGGGAGILVPFVDGSPLGAGNQPGFTLVPGTRPYYTLDSTSDEAVIAVGGFLRNLTAIVTSATSGGDIVLTVYRNGVATSLTLTIPSGSAAGSYKNTSSSICVAPGETIRVVTTNPTSSVVCSWGLEMMACSGNGLVGADFNAGPLTTSTKIFRTFFTNNNENTVETNSKTPWAVPGTLKRMMVRTLTANSASGSVTIAVRKNGVDTSILVVIPASGAAGVYADFINTVAVAAGDIINLHVSKSFGSGSASIANVSFEFDPTPNSDIIGGHPWVNFDSDNDVFFGPFGRYAGADSGAPAKEADYAMTRSGTLKNLYLHIVGPTPANGNAVFTFVKNDVDTGLTITIAGGSATGVYSNTGNTVSVAQGDRIRIKGVCSSAPLEGVVAMRGWSMELTRA